MKRKTKRKGGKRTARRKTSKKSSPKIVKESSKAIESSYGLEKRKIDSAIRMLEKERLQSYIVLMGKRQTIVGVKKQKLNELERSINQHARSVKSEITQLKKKKVSEKVHFDHLYVLNEHLKKIESQVC